MVTLSGGGGGGGKKNRSRSTIAFSAMCALAKPEIRIRGWVKKIKAW